MNSVIDINNIVFGIGGIDNNGNNVDSYTPPTAITKYMRSDDFIEAPVRITAIGEKYQFYVFVYDLNGKFLHKNGGDGYTEINLTNRDYLYRIVSSKSDESAIFTTETPTYEEVVEASKNIKI